MSGLTERSVSTAQLMKTHGYSARTDYHKDTQDHKTHKRNPVDSMKGEHGMSEIYRQYEAALALCTNEAQQLSTQREYLLPVIAEEKEAFISAEYGRLQQIMGVEYTDGDSPKIFHPLPETLKAGENLVYGDPRELSLAELAMLPYLTFKINRFGAVSRMPLIQCYPTDIARMQLLAALYEKLMVGRICTADDAASLLNGHTKYINFKNGGQVIVIK